MHCLPLGCASQGGIAANPVQGFQEARFLSLSRFLHVNHSGHTWCLHTLQVDALFPTAAISQPATWAGFRNCSALNWLQASCLPWSQPVWQKPPHQPKGGYCLLPAVNECPSYVTGSENLPTVTKCFLESLPSGSSWNPGGESLSGDEERPPFLQT